MNPTNPTNPTNQVRVVLVDDHALVRQGVRLFLSSLETPSGQSELVVVGEAGDSATALHVITETTPDVVLMDVSLGAETSLTLIRRLKQVYSGMRILAVTAHTDDATVSGVLNAGADGYMLKDVALEELAQAVRAIALGHFVLHPLVARRWSAISGRDGAREDTLSPREVEVLQHMAEGATSKEIARQLSLSAKTIENHRANILGKLQARNAAEAVTIALERGLIRRR
jgi:two-component system, NarL family, response regulator LiaR